MIIPLRLSLPRVLKRISGALVLLLTLVAADLCSAGELSFGNNYSLQLPADWKATLKQDQTLGATGPDGVSLDAFIHKTDRSPEEVMEMLITRKEEKPGYKFLEKGSVKINADRTVQLVRYRLDGKREKLLWVEYYLQLAEKEVVTLMFAFPAASAKSFKSDFEAIVSSVKRTGANSSVDKSYLTAPVENSKDPKTASGKDSENSGDIRQ